MTDDEAPRIVLEPLDHWVEIRHNGDPIAASNDTLRLAERGYPPRLYLPREAVTGARLIESATRTHCPFKGDATYFDLVIGEKHLADAAWSYADPVADMAAIAERVAFDHPALAID